MTRCSVCKEYGQDMIDFPVSWDFNRHYSLYYGQPDPGPNMVAESTRVEELEDRIGNLEAISAEPGRMPRRYYDQMQQLKAQVTYLQNKVNELVAVRKRLKQEVVHE